MKNKEVYLGEISDENKYSRLKKFIPNLDNE